MPDALQRASCMQKMRRVAAKRKRWMKRDPRGA
jgi:hypothetical protein